MVGPPWIAVLGSGPRVDADNRSHTNPLTGKPDAGDPPVRFGGRGSGKPLSLVRLRRRWVGAVEVRSHAVENRMVSNRNCVAATRGGEQWNENDQSVTNVLLGRRTP